MGDLDPELVAEFLADIDDLLRAIDERPPNFPKKPPDYDDWEPHEPGE